MTQVKLLPSDGRRQRKEERQGNDSSSNIKLRPATTTTTTPRGRKERTPRNGLDLKDNVRVSEARPSSGSRRTSGSKSASVSIRLRSCGDIGNYIHNVQMWLGCVRNAIGQEADRRNRLSSMRTCME
ncbi:hypothetical protein FOZ63_029099 [Perkinsus olseni]|uniref:Uncharacterized protein n=1 Tax=Perkinsus olseni TaxID=32597 RepID=A0A7J6PV97_PEROL|nr:hypothetical protein FOZ63_029099 [Perkinsus olseni]